MCFYRGGQILTDAGCLTASGLQSDIKDLEAKENMLDQLITSAGRVDYHNL
jgi:deoxyhypusine synthase